MCGILFAALVQPSGVPLPVNFVKYLESLEEENKLRGLCFTQNNIHFSEMLPKDPIFRRVIDFLFQVVQTVP